LSFETRVTNTLLTGVMFQSQSVSLAAIHVRNKY